MEILDLFEQVKEANAVTVELGNDNVIHIKKYLTVSEFASFISQMREAEFDQDGTYRPDLGLLIFKMCLVGLYTDVELPEDLEQAYQIINALELDRKIIEVAGQTIQYQDLLECIERALNYERDARTGVHSLYNVVKDGIKAIPWDRMDEALTDLANPKNMDKLTKALKVLNINDFR